MATLLSLSLPADPFFILLLLILGGVIVFSLIFVVYFVVWGIPNQPLARLHRIAANGKKAPGTVCAVILADLVWWLLESFFPINSPFNWVVVMAGVDAWFFWYAFMLVLGARRARKRIRALEAHGKHME